jgi:hypothetical protein
MRPDTLGGVVSVVIVAYFLLWRLSMFRDILRRCGHILEHLRSTKV